MSVTNKLHILALVAICSLLFWQLAATPHIALPLDRIVAEGDSVQNIVADSLIADTLLQDSVPGLPIPPKKEKDSGLDAPVEYQASDSIVFMNSNIAYMYGDGVVNYKDIQLDAAVIEMDMDSSMVYAIGAPDSLGVEQGLPKFKDASGEYDSQTLKYSFETQKGYITNMVTQQGEGFLTGGKTKKTEGSDLYMEGGRYTTCDDHDCPHFYLQLTKAKVRPKKNIVTGPAYLVLLDVPLPLAIPFGFFPFTDTYSSGILMPTYGEDSSQGFYLRDGGYYFAASEYFDLALTGDIYSYGSWGLDAQSNYSKRYKYSGSFSMGYLKTITGDVGLDDYSEQTNFSLKWSHSQDSKANPNMSFSASVNFSTSGYNRNDMTSYYDASSFTENTKSSTVNMTYKFPDTPFSLSTSASITQRSSDSTISVSFPSFTLSMSRIYPFKRENPIGNERWYEKVSFNYTGVFSNSITTTESEFMEASLIKDWTNGLKHTVPVSATFTLFDYLNITPSFSFTDRMYTSKQTQEYDPDTGTGVVVDTTYGFYNVYNYSTSVSMQTKLYGFFKPLPFLGLKKIEAIRHVFTPSVTFSYAPDFSDAKFGSWETLHYTDPTTGEDAIYKYSPFSSGMYGTTSSGKSGTVSFSMTNNLEMKMQSDRDTTGVRKVSLIENLTAGISYNMAADSMNWSNLSTSILLKLTKSFNLNLSATFDTYTYQLNSYGNPVRVNIPRWEAGKGLGRLMSTGSSFSYTFNNDTFKKLFGGEESSGAAGKSGGLTGDRGAPPTNEDEMGGEMGEMGDGKPSKGGQKEEKSKVSSDGYMKWDVPWSLSFSYSVNYGYGDFNYDKLEYDTEISQNLSFSGSITPTENWSFSFSSSYDFDAKEIAYMSCNISRNMHCWQMSASFIPFGTYKSYSFNIGVKSSLLSDLKYDKSSSVYDQLEWY